MRRSFGVLVLVCVLAFAAACAGSAAAGTRVAAAGAHKITVGDALPLPGLSFADHLQAADYEDLWTVYLGGGQQIIAKLDPPSGEDFRVALWSPGTTGFGDLNAALAVSAGGFDDPRSLKYQVPSWGAGTHFLDVWSAWSSVYDSSYLMSVNIQSPTSNVKITPPAVPWTVRLYRNYSSWGSLRPLHFVGEQTVTVQWQKYRGGRWRSAGSVKANNYDSADDQYTRYKVNYSFSGYGSGKIHWRVRAVHPADTLHPRKVSAWRYFWVKL